MAGRDADGVDLMGKGHFLTCRPRTSAVGGWGVPDQQVSHEAFSEHLCPQVQEVAHWRILPPLVPRVNGPSVDAAVKPVSVETAEQVQQDEVSEIEGASASVQVVFD